MVDTIYCLRDTIFLTYCDTAAVETKRSERKGVHFTAGIFCFIHYV